ncbi:unnamed protein product [Boreogadus saida]
MAECLPPHPEQVLHLLTQSQTSTSCQSSRTGQCSGAVDRRLRLETRGLQHRTRGEPQMQEVGCVASLGWWRIWWRACLVNDVCRGNVFLERRRAGRGAVNLEDDQHSTNKDYTLQLLLCYAPLEPNYSGGLMEKPYIWKANPEDHQDSTIKDSS